MKQNKTSTKWRNVFVCILYWYCHPFLCEKYNFYDLLLDNSLQGVDVHGLLQANFVLSVSFL
jgi:hypothetical protein